MRSEVASSLIEKPATAFGAAPAGESEASGGPGQATEWMIAGERRAYRSDGDGGGICEDVHGSARGGHSVERLCTRRSHTSQWVKRVLVRSNTQSVSLYATLAAIRPLRLAAFASASAHRNPKPNTGPIKGR